MAAAEERKMRVMVNKVGGNAGSTSVNYRVSLPNTWVQELGISKDDREVTMRFDGKEIVITKRSGNDGQRTEV